MAGEATFTYHYVTIREGSDIHWFRDPQHPGHRLAQGRGLLGTGMRNRRWATGERRRPSLNLQQLPSLALRPELHLLSDQWRHNKCNALESARNQPPPWSVEKLSSMKPIPGARRLDTVVLIHSLRISNQRKNACHYLESSRRASWRR